MTPRVGLGLLASLATLVPQLNVGCLRDVPLC